MLQYIVMFLYECTDLYVQWKIAFEAWAHATYQNVEWVRKMIDAISYFKKDTYNNYYCIRTEPDIGEWVNMSYSIQYSDSIIHHYCEKYDQTHVNASRSRTGTEGPLMELVVLGDRRSLCEGELPSDQVHTDKHARIETYVLGTQDIQLKASYTSGIVSDNGLWLMKCGESCYLSRVLPAVTEKAPENITNIDGDMTNRKKSKVRFLSIIYSHPRMNHDIELQLPNTMYYVGNELFSPVFVLRMLEYTVGSASNYVFDLNYTLKIMDRNVKYRELSSKEYITLGEQSHEYIVSVL